MRRSYPKARRFDPEREGSGSHHAVRLRPRFDPLALPSLDVGSSCAIPSRNCARLALQFLDAGYLKDAHSDLHAGTLVCNAVQECIDQNKGETPAFADMQMYLSVSTAPTIYDPDYGDGNPLDLTEKFSDNWHYCLEAHGVESRLLEPRFAAIEAKAPGLFKTALDAFTDAVYPIITPGTPESIRALATRYFWFDTDNQEAFVEEFVMYNDDVPQEEDGIISPESFRQGLPAWLVSPQQTIESEDSKPSEYSMRLSDTELEILASHGDPEIARIAQCTIDLKLHAVKLDKSNLMFYPQDGYTPVYPLLLLRWNTQDQIRHSFDEYIHVANGNCDCYTPEFASTFVGRDDESFKAWLSGFEAAMTILNRAHCLVELISVPDNY